jgi:hypothetical protein
MAGRPGDTKKVGFVSSQNCPLSIGLGLDSLPGPWRVSETERSTLAWPMMWEEDSLHKDTI